MHCFCDTCNDTEATPCASDAECVAVGATTCGGKRCVAGTNVGAPCASMSECPSGGCQVIGWPTQPNACDDAVCSLNTPPDADSVAEGAGTLLDHTVVVWVTELATPTHLHDDTFTGLAGAGNVDRFLPGRHRCRSIPGFRLRHRQVGVRFGVI